MSTRPLIAYGFVIPAILALGVLTLYPVLFGLYTSLHSWNWLAGQAENMTFKGLGNYIELLKDPYFLNSIGRTLYFTLLAVGIQFILGFTVALLLNEEIKGSWFFRSAVIFPMMISDIVAALIWRSLLDPTLGPLNYYLEMLHIPAPNWLASTSAVIPGLAMVDTWWQTGNIALILLAGLQSLPKDRFEMAQVDGASGWKMLRYITIPGLKPFILVALIFRTIDCLRVFALSWGITAGGPMRASEVSQLYIYSQGVGRLLRMGYSAALAIAFSLIVGVIAGVYIYLLQKGRVQHA
ncbi:MAG: sugar ABC transporter permease [Firmicutes bacterium]|nr:sugar ABC transporter permease [Bacillota bacterium]